ncbi:MAG TPA: hypothetical protein VHQ86_00640, partial [Candidatus Saccharimonadia bacterium]|nr:hypothetical protein [Candidatus Saccharimonadia bacterium]
MANNPRSILITVLHAAAVILTVGGALVLWAAYATNLFLGSCLAASGCHTFVSNSGLRILAAFVLCLGLAGLAWWFRANRPLLLMSGTAIVTAVTAILFNAMRTCTLECGPSAVGDLGGCSVVHHCMVHPALYALWLLPLIAIGY